MSRPASTHAEKRIFRLSQFATVIAARKQMAVYIGSHDDAGMSETLLHSFHWQFKAAVFLSVDAPRRIEVSQRGKKLFEAVCDLGLEGIVSKRLTSVYRSGRSKALIKIKNPKSPAATRVIDGTF
jgi:hypothetical protein